MKRFLGLALAFTLASYGMPQTASAAPPTLQASALKLYRRTIQRYSAMRSYSDEVSLRVTSNNGALSPAMAKQLSFKARLNLERINKVRLERMDGVKALAVSDGVTLGAKSSLYPGYYVKRPVGARALAVVTQEAGVGAPGLGFLTGEYNLARLHLQGLQWMGLGKNSTVKGVPCQTLVLRAKSRQGEGFTMQIAIGQKDGVIHQLTQTSSGRNGTATVVESHEKIRVNPTFPATNWKLTPPAQAQLLDSFLRLRRR